MRQIMHNSTINNNISASFSGFEQFSTLCTVYKQQCNVFFLSDTILSRLYDDANSETSGSFN